MLFSFGSKGIVTESSDFEGDVGHAGDNAEGKAFCSEI